MHKLVMRTGFSLVIFKTSSLSARYLIDEVLISTLLPLLQVLLSEEVDGSLRKLKGVPLLTKDRFKALQKQGLIEPRVRIEEKMRRKRVAYQTGDRAEKIKEGHDATTKTIKSRDRARAKKKLSK